MEHVVAAGDETVGRGQFKKHTDWFVEASYNEATDRCKEIL